jgi:chaperonin GroES
MTIKSLGNRLVVQLVKQKNTTASGIIVSTEEKNEQARGQIISIGAGADVDNEINITKLGLKAGDVVVFGKYAGEEITDETTPDTVYKILSSKDILAIVED